MLMQLPLALLSRSASFLEQLDHIVFRRACHRLSDAAEAYGAGPVQITLQARYGVWTHPHTYMHSSSVVCDFSAISHMDVMVRFIHQISHHHVRHDVCQPKSRRGLQLERFASVTNRP